ncbi:NADH-quinone oxidoreductase subunit C [Streptomyces sp. TLI_146]|uniref:NADH-quinone oxidoreductase subunit C n=1 Tax=Streptomyces sp. TLI_146 TaxID=1938858 RepID=UPI000C70374C|nr:NADH-quinone oxidoreductase subunit C [Streptomyces sp. TLI_146]PKV87229.1 NADH:ubiquinone oxidoreductase subunit C [Streptomyces sp. TLI_146]
MTAYDRLPDAVTEIFGEEATAEEAYGLLTVDVPVGSWLPALEIARDELGCTYFDWLSAVDEPGTGFRVCAHVVSLEGRRVRRLLVRTTVPHTAPVLASAVDVYAGAAWHERETHEMFGVTFEGHPNLIPLLLPEGFEGHPLRKDFVLAARVAKAWPGAKEPGESEHGGPKRRQMLPPGVPDPNEWGPLKGQLPPAPARTPRAAGDRPVRRTRTVTEGSASQAPTPATAEGTAPPPRRARSASQGSASQAPEAPQAPEAAPSSGAPAPEAPTPRPRRTRTASEGSASQAPAAPAAPEVPAAPETPEATQAPEATPGAAPDAGTPPRPPRRNRSVSEGSASQAQASARPEATAPPRTRSTDAPWNNPRPAFDDAPQGPAADEPTGSAAATEAAEATEATEAPKAAEAREAGEAAEATKATEATRATEATEATKATEARPAGSDDRARDTSATTDPDPDPEPDTPAGGEPA